MRLLSIATLAVSATLVACTPPQESTGPETLPPIRAQRVDQAAALLPKDIHLAQPGSFTVAMVVGQLPLADFTPDGKTVVGDEPNIAQVIADSLGLKLNIVSVAWPDWPLGLQSGKYDAVMANVTVTDERKDKFDFSTYRDDQLGIYTRTGGPIKAIAGARDIAGLKVALAASTNQSQIFDRWNADNIAAGLKAAVPQYYDDSGLTRLSVLSGQADVSFAPNALSAYQARDGKMRKVGAVSGGWPLTAYIAVTTRKNSGLAAPITAALNAQMKNGKYAAILKRWSLTEEAIKESRTNPPGLPRT